MTFYWENNLQTEACETSNKVSRNDFKIFYVERLEALTELKLTPPGSLLFQILITRSQKEEGSDSSDVCFMKFILMTSSIGDTTHHKEVIHIEILCQVKGRYSSSWGDTASELRDVTCHMGSHSVTCHPTQVNAPRLTTAMQAGTRFTYPGGMEGWVDLVDLVAPRPWVEPVTFRSITSPTPNQSNMFNSDTKTNCSAYSIK